VNSHSSALFFASLGWHVVAMESGSKNPGSIVGQGWPEHCTTEPAKINRWFSDHPDANIGVLLGQKSNVIDLEYDSDEGRQIIEPACIGIITPTYKSAKSVHRLFRYEDRFTPEKAKVGLRGTEWRFGQDSAQSVFPPSLHETGVRYEWLPGMSPDDCAVLSLPDELWLLFLKMKAEHELKTARNPTHRVPSRYVSGDSLLNRTRKFVEETMTWENILSGDGWKYCRKRGDAQDWWRPGKTSGSISGTVNYGGSGTLRIFSANVSPLESESSYDKFSYLCRTKHGDNPVEAAFALLPEHIRNMPRGNNQRPVDLSGLMKSDQPDEIEDEELCLEMVPDFGILRDVYDYYCIISHKASPIMGLCVAISLCQTIFGRRVASHTDMRTNDYNVIVAPTCSGKEACEQTIIKILSAAEPDASKLPLIPVDIQSGNGLITALSLAKSAIWICDEFGKVMQSILNPKTGNDHSRKIGDHLYRLYGKRLHTGAAHSKGTCNIIEQPSLCVLGLTTDKAFQSFNADHITDGLMSRLAFWIVQSRPDKKTAKPIPVPVKLADDVSKWLTFSPCGLRPDVPVPKVIQFSEAAKERWEGHDKKIDTAMKTEGDARSAIWGRTSGRSMNLALVSRCSRLCRDPEEANWDEVLVEEEDVEFGIRISNWITRTMCGLISENIADSHALKAQHILLTAVAENPIVGRRELMRKFRSITSTELSAAVTVLVADGKIEVIESPRTGTKGVSYRAKV